MTAAEFRRVGHRVIDRIAEYFETVEGLPVLSRVQPGEVAGMLPQRPPEHGEDWERILEDAIGPDGPVIRGLTHWQSPNFFAFFPANSSYPGILGDLVSTGLGVQGMLWATSPACTEIETRVLDWLAGMIGLPERFLSTSAGGGGVIQGTASEATLVSLLAARARARPTGSSGEDVIYASDQAHSSIMKAAMIAGLAAGAEDTRRVRFIPTDAEYAMRPDALAKAMAEDAGAGRRPVWVCATVGTTSSGAVDPVGAMGAACRKHGAWLHVDAAWAGSAWVCPEFRGELGGEGVWMADSVSFNPHKWLLTNFDCSAMWTADRAALTGALSVTPEYLRNRASSSGAVIDYRDWQIPLGRRFRALKLWFVIRHYGVKGLQAHIRGHARLGEIFESLVRSDPRFEVAAPRRLSLVCFRLRGDDADRRNRELLERINASGKAYLTHTVLPAGMGTSASRYVLRMAIGATRTEERHVRAAWEVVRAAADEVCCAR